MSADSNLSHEPRADSFLESKQQLIEKIVNQGDLPYLSAQKQLDIVDQLSDFPFGRFLIERGGLDGYWTHYVVQHPLRKEGRKDIGELESFLLNASPSSLATQERFAIFKTEIQKRLRNGSRLASIPCGLMADLIDLNYTHIDDFSLTGIDLDPRSLTLAKEYAEEKGLGNHCAFSQSDAWNLQADHKFDLIASNGLNIYEPSDEKVTALYRQFYNALNEGGVLVTSFLTPPPMPGKETEWKLDAVNQKDALFQKILFVDILSAKWQVFRTAEQTKKQLEDAGFRSVELIYDRAHIFPTVIATK